MTWHMNMFQKHASLTHLTWSTEKPKTAWIIAAQATEMSEIWVDTAPVAVTDVKHLFVLIVAAKCVAEILYRASDADNKLYL